LRFLKIFKADQEISLTEADHLLAYRQTGDLRMLGKLYQPYMEMVFSVCYKYLKDEDDCKDAVMQIFEKLVTDLKTHQVENFKSWLHRVTVNHCLMHIRSRRVFVAMDEMGEQNHFYNETDDQTEFTIDKDLSSMEECLQTLNEEQRRSINLFFKEEKCYREISEETGFDFNKVKSYIQNGKRNLKICMDRNGSN
jgi:RNA polymerase sigma factor (sigma-70 family)